MKVTRGKIWRGREWEDAIRMSFTTPDGGIEPVYKYKHPELLLGDEKILVGYQMFAQDNRREYHTRIPAKYNQLVEMLLKKKGGK